MSQDTRTALLRSLKVERENESERRWPVFALLAMVVLLDQVTKWWGWRQTSYAVINPGGDLLVGSTVGSWYADPMTGALLDALGVAFLSVAVFVLTRRRRPAAVLGCAALMIGGWSSNLLDRLGMHRWTAPGSIRGAVDFIPIGPYYYNVADLVIVSSTLLLLLSVGYQLGRMTDWTTAVRP